MYLLSNILILYNIVSKIISFSISLYFFSLITHTIQNVIQYREREAIRLCLKHFRQRGASFLGVYETLKASSGVSLEDARLSALHDALVLQADYPAAEDFMGQALQGESGLTKLLNYSSCIVLS